MAVVYVAFLWHMHQPWYVLPSTGEAILPWVRLRATKDYYDMGKIIESCGAQVTVNFSPSLTEQLRRYAAGELTDPYQALFRPPEEAPLKLLGAFPVPKSRRGAPGPRGQPIDQQVRFHLAWTGQVALEEDQELGALWAKGRGFGISELSFLERKHTEMLGELLPLYRRLSQGGQTELSATPFYHPILPLIIDTGIARRCQPEAPLPAFSSPEDALDQVRRALAHHSETFGERPLGMWPAEGAVSPEAVALLAEAGLSWIATDGEILARTLGRAPTPEELHRPWRFRAPEGEIAVLFRDTSLSNRISFDYHSWEPRKAVADLLGHLRAVGKGWRGKAPPLVLIAMDGENAWDGYDRNGRPFLEGLYRGIAADPKLEMIGVGEYLRRFGAEGELQGLWSGSWINADFSTWIGDKDQNRAWELLGTTHRAVSESADSECKARAQEYLYVAEGSDWFWWYGPFHSSPQEPDFDRLFREHLAQAFRELGREPPKGLEGGG